MSMVKVSELKQRYRRNIINSITNEEREHWQAMMDELKEFERESKTDHE